MGVGCVRFELQRLSVSLFRLGYTPAFLQRMPVLHPNRRRVRECPQRLAIMVGSRLPFACVASPIGAIEHIGTGPAPHPLAADEAAELKPWTDHLRCPKRVPLQLEGHRSHLGRLESSCTPAFPQSLVERTPSRYCIAGRRR